MKTPTEVYDEIRKANPGRPFGDHWECVGYYIGEGSWCDPQYVGMPGEYEHEYDLQNDRQASPE